MSHALRSLPAARLAMLALLTCSGAAASAADATYRVIARTGQAAPGGGAFATFGVPSISAGGRVAFKASLTGVLGPSGVWSEGIAGLNNLQLVVRQGSPIPGAAGSFFGEINQGDLSLIVNTQGEVAFSARITGNQAAFGAWGIFAHSAEGLESIAMPGQLVSLPCGGVGCSRWLTNILPSAFAFNTQGQVVCVSSIAGSGVNGANDELILLASASGLEVVMREGDAPPNTFDVAFSSPALHPVLLNDAGQALFRNFLDTAQPADLWTVWRGLPGDLQLLAAANWAAPVGGLFRSDILDNGRMGFNNAGSVTFVQSVNANGGPAAGLWRTDGGSIEALCYDGVPGPESTEHESPETPTGAVNAGGDTVIACDLQGPGVSIDNDEAIILRHADGQQEFIAREGGQAPGFLAGVHFGSFGGHAQTILNDGRVVFGAVIDGPGVHAANNECLWISRPDAEPAMLVREGQTMVIGGALRTVQSFTAAYGSGPESGVSSGASDLGQVAMRLTFTDTTQAIVVASPVSACPGDVNGDGVVNFVDLNALVGDFGYAGDVIATDLDLDGDVDFADLNRLLANFNAVCGD